jgi:site-specific recombinase XerD
VTQRLHKGAASTDADARADTGPQAGPPASKQTVDVLTAAHLDALAKAGKAAHTIASTRLDLGQLGRFLGRQPVGKVTADDLRAFFGWLERQQGNGVGSLRRKTSTVKHFFRQLHADDVLTFDPSAELIYPALVEQDRAPLTTAELDAIMQAAGTPHWRALLLCVVDTGLKRDELVALRTDDIEVPPAVPAPGRLHVRHRRAARRVRQRTLALTERLAAALAVVLPTEGTNAATAESSPAGSVFGLSARGVDFAVETCGRRAGVRPGQKITPQQVRDGFARARMAALVAREAALFNDRAALREARREHDRLFVRELGLSDRSTLPERYRRLLGGLQPDRAEEGRLNDDHLAAPDQFKDGK